MTAIATVTNTLTLSSGAVKTGVNVLSLGTGRSNLGTLTRTNGKIVGSFRRWIDSAATSNILFPVGTDTTYRPVDLSFTSKPAHAGTLTAMFAETNPSTLGLPVNDDGTSLINIASEGYWSLTAADSLTGGTYSLDITAEDIAGVSNYATLRLLKRAFNTSPWIAPGAHAPGTGSNAIPIVHRTGMTGFSDFAIGGGADNTLGVKQCALTVLLEGFYNQAINKMTPDTIRVYLRNFVPPFAILDTMTVLLDSNGTATLLTTIAANNVFYYLAIQHRNSIETWCGTPLRFENGTAVFDMTTAPVQAYGGNLILRGTEWCIYSGDVNQDGIVDFTDLSMVDNDQYNFVAGYVPTDLTGDDFVDFSDLSICDNNSFNFISAVTPLVSTRSKDEHTRKVERKKTEE
jgi:hypothetical protein